MSKKTIKVAFQGTKGAYSEEAIEQFFGKDAKPVGFEYSNNVFQSVQQEECDFGMLPIENSIAGHVDINLDLFTQDNFFISGETYLPINHTLLALPGTTLDEIKEVYSHPIALEQCKDFLTRHNIKAIPDFDTAGAALKLMNNKFKGVGTISSKNCAEHYNLDIVENRIQRFPNNYTRFLAFVKKENIPEGLKQEKTSIAITTKHNPGALLNCLKEFADSEINLTKLESRPIPENPFNYIFYIDFLSALDCARTQDCLKRLKANAEQILILGSYPLGKLGK